MTANVLGRREGQHLEFKTAGVLEEPSQIARAVVGMLNAEGGEIWIGVDEENEVAVAVKPVGDAGKASRRLQDFLLDTLDPSPTLEELPEIELEPPGAETALLRVRVQPAEHRKPYAFRKGGAWHFLRRVGARNHPMSRQEIFGPERFGVGAQGLAETIGELVKARQELQEAGESGLWLGLRPARKLEIDLQDPLLERIAEDPSLTGNRRGGWHFARSGSRPTLSKDAVQWGLASGLTGERVTRADLFESGELRFLASLSRLHWKGEDNELWPFALLEHPISAFRIARAVYQDSLSSDDQVATDLALLGVGGWGLREGTPGDFFEINDLILQEEPDLIWEPVVFRFQEINESPDRCGFRLVRRIYQAFGLRDSALPRQYDPETGKLLLPE